MYDFKAWLFFRVLLEYEGVGDARRTAAYAVLCQEVVVPREDFAFVHPAADAPRA